MIRSKPKKAPIIPKDIVDNRAELKAAKPRGSKRIVNRKKTTTQIKLRSQADKLAREFCKRDACCVSCRSGVKWQGSNRLEWAHIISRGEWRLRHTPFNCVPLCNVCHRNYTHNPKLWVDFVERVFPGRWEKLEELLQMDKAQNPKPDYEYWVDFYKGRSDSWMEYFADELGRAA